MSLDVKDTVAIFCSSPQPRKHGGKAMTGCCRALDRSGLRGGTVVAADPNPSAFSERQRVSAVVMGRDGRWIRMVGCPGTERRWSRRQAAVPNTGS